MEYGHYLDLVLIEEVVRPQSPLGVGIVEGDRLEFASFAWLYSIRHLPLL